MIVDIIWRSLQVPCITFYETIFGFFVNISCCAVMFICLKWFSITFLLNLNLTNSRILGRTRSAVLHGAADERRTNEEDTAGGSYQAAKEKVCRKESC